MTRKSSRLRQVPDELIIPDRSNGGRAKLMGTGVVEYDCAKCDATFWMKSRLANQCPACGAKEISMNWTTPMVAFIPEGPAE